MNGFSVFKNKWFSLYYLSATLSKIGDNVYRFAIPFIVLEMTDSVAYMTAMWVAEIAPFIVLGPFIGVLVDRLDRRKIMLWSDFMRAVLIILLPTLSFLHMLDLWVLFAVGFLLSIFTICFDLVADFGLIPQLVKSGDLTKANAYFRSMDELSRMVGPVIAGAVIALVGAQTSLFIDALSYFFTLAVIWFIPINFNIGVKIEEPMSVRNVLKDISEGFIHIFRSKILWCLHLLGTP